MVKPISFACLFQATSNTIRMDSEQYKEKLCLKKIMNLIYLDPFMPDDIYVLFQFLLTLIKPKLSFHCLLLATLLNKTQPSFLFLEHVRLRLTSLRNSRTWHLLIPLPEIFFSGFICSCSIHLIFHFSPYILWSLFS